MSRTNTQNKPLLIALALLAALAMGAGLVRGPTDEEVLAAAVRDFASGEGTVLHPAAAKLSPSTDATEATEVEKNARKIRHLRLTLSPTIPAAVEGDPVRHRGVRLSLALGDVNGSSLPKVTK